MLRSVVEPETVGQVIEKLEKIETEREKTEFLKKRHPEIYWLKKKSMSNRYELQTLHGISPKFDDMERHTYIELLPKLVELRNQNKLFHNMASYVTLDKC